MTTQPVTKPAALPVLLIEDEPAVMAYVRAALERSGYSVVCTESGAQGVRLLESGEFLGVVSDMRTPGGVNGADVHAWVVQHRPELTDRIGHLALRGILKLGDRKAERPQGRRHGLRVVHRVHQR